MSDALTEARAQLSRSRGGLPVRQSASDPVRIGSAGHRHFRTAFEVDPADVEVDTVTNRQAFFAASHPAMSRIC